MREIRMPCPSSIRSKAQFVLDFSQHLIARRCDDWHSSRWKKRAFVLPNDAYKAAAISGVGELVIPAGVSFKRLPIRLE
jgi:hypothetical protein